MFWSWESMGIGSGKMLFSVLSVVPYLLMALYMYHETGTFCLWFGGLEWWQETIAEMFLVPMSFFWSFMTEEWQRVRTFLVWLLTFVGLCVCLYFQWDYVDVPLAVWFVAVPLMVHDYVFSREKKTILSGILLLACTVVPIPAYMCVLNFFGVDIPQYPMGYVGILTAVVTFVVCFQTWNDSKTTQVTCKSNQKTAYCPDSNGGVKFGVPQKKVRFHDEGKEFEVETTTGEKYFVTFFVFSLRQSGTEALLFVLVLVVLFQEMKRACYAFTNIFWVRQEPGPVSNAVWLLVRACLVSFTVVLFILQKLQGHNLRMTAECAKRSDLFSQWVAGPAPPVEK